MDSPFRITRNSYLHIMFLLVLASMLWSCSGHSNIADNITYEINIHDKKPRVEVAFRQKERTIGLMFREKLDSDHGMLFIYPQEQNLSFWMKNTRIPLSIAFINSSETITQIEPMAPYSLASHTSKVKVRFALEMEEGWFRKNGITVGSKVDFSSEIRNLKVE
ncbi:MAG: DUF192 domain-containing protein [Candidatus Scalindua sp.]|nr:DUF192 domain-containing protein [Candidatus Scalindua sp.]